MSLNHAEIDKIVEEAEIENSFIQEIVQYDYHHILFYLYEPGKENILLFSLSPGKIRLNLTDRKRKALSKPPRFTAVLKSKIRGSKIIKAEQVGKERIVQFNLKKGDYNYYLFFKLWENNVNIILTDNNYSIIDCFSRRPARNEIPGYIFNPQSFISNKVPQKEIREYPGDGNLNNRIDSWFHKQEYENEIKILKDRIVSRLEKRLKQLEKSVLNQKKKISDNSYKKFKYYADLIMGNLHHINKGDKFFEVDDNGSLLKITLDQHLDPWINGENYYKRYKKKKEELKRINPESELDEIKKIKAKLKKIKESEDLLFLRNEDQRYKKQKIKTTSRKPGLTFNSNGFQIVAGRNARENDQLLRKYVKGNDTWLHTRDCPGGYIFIKANKGKTIPLDVLLDAGNLAIIYSKLKDETEADLHYTQVKYLRRVKDGPKGLVIPTQERNLLIKRDEKRIAKLMKTKEN